MVNGGCFRGGKVVLCVKIKNKLNYSYTTAQCSEGKLYLFCLLMKMFGPKREKIKSKEGTLHALYNFTSKCKILVG